MTKYCFLCGGSGDFYGRKCTKCKGSGIIIRFDWEGFTAFWLAITVTVLLYYFEVFE